MKGATYYVAIATVILSHVKISSFRAKAHLLFFSIGVYIIIWFPLQGLQEDRVKSPDFTVFKQHAWSTVFQLFGHATSAGLAWLACKNLASRPIATLKPIWRSRKLHFALRQNKWYFSTEILLGEEKKKMLPIPGVEPGPPGWKPGILTARPYGNDCVAMQQN